MSLDFDEYLRRPVDLKELINKLDFTEEEVEHAATEQPKLFLRVSRFRVQKMRDRVEAELAYENKKAKLSSKYQSKKDDKGKRKLTEGAVSAKVQLDPEIHKLRRKMEMSYVYEKGSELLVEAYRSREKAIKIVMDARWAEGGKAFRQVNEESGRRLSKKLANEVREKFKNRRSRSSDD